MNTQNQIRQFLPVSSYSTSLNAVGQVAVTKTEEGEYNVKYVDSTGKVISFAIPAKNILWKKATPANKMEDTVKAVLVTLNDDYLDDDNLICGQDYELRIRINSLYWDTDYTWGYKYGIVHATKNMTPSDFYAKMAMSLAKNFGRYETPMLKFYVKTSGGATEVTATTTESDLNGTYTGIVIEEVEQPWRLGTMPQTRVEFIAIPDTIIYSGEEVAWGEEPVQIAGSTTIGNGKKVADMEYFYHGERGDYNREAAWPNNWPLVTQIDPSKSYDLIDIHWYWIGNNHAIQRSEKDLTLAFDSTSHTAANAFLDAWNDLNLGTEFEADAFANPAEPLN